MTAGQVVRRFWEQMQARDWPAAQALLVPDVLVEWPATGERFVGADAVIAVNRDYPEGWTIEVVSVVPGMDGVTAASEVEVVQEGVGVFAAASFWHLRVGLIERGREYWVQCGGDEPPPWRAGYASRYSGRLHDRG
jgi:ketosteroid isomerase-like protein